MVQMWREWVGAATKVEIVGEIESVAQKLDERISRESGERKNRIRRLTARAISIL